MYIFVFKSDKDFFILANLKICLNINYLSIICCLFIINLHFSCLVGDNRIRFRHGKRIKLDLTDGKALFVVEVSELCVFCHKSENLNSSTSEKFWTITCEQKGHERSMLLDALASLFHHLSTNHSL